MVNDRDITGTGIPVPFFGSPAPISPGAGAAGPRDRHAGLRGRRAADRRRALRGQGDRRPVAGRGHPPGARGRAHGRHRRRLRDHPGRRPRAVVGSVPPDLAGPRRRAGRRPGRPTSPQRTARPRRPPRDADPSSGSAAPTCTSTRSPRTAPRPCRRSWTTWRRRASWTSSPSPTTSGSTRRSRRGTWPRTAACAPAVVVGEEISTRGGHLLALFLERPVPSLKALALVHRGGPRPGRDRDPRPPARAVPDVRPGLRAPAPAGRRQPGRPPGHHRDLQPHGAGQVPPRGGRPVRGGAWPGPGRQQRRPRRLRDRRLLDDLPGPDARGLPPGRRGGADGAPRRLPRLVRPGGRVRAPAAQVRARMAGDDRRPAAPRWDGPGSRVPRRHAASAAVRSLHGKGGCGA